MSALQGLDVRLLVDADDHGVLWGIEIEPDDVRRLAGELGVGARTPAATPLEGNPPSGQNAPDLVLGDVPKASARSLPFHLA